jgi:hypothetical protein
VSDRDASTDILFTRSASRWADYYLAGGVRRQFVTTRETRTVETEFGPQGVTVVVPPNWKVVVETGVKIRAKLPVKMRPFVLGLQLRRAAVRPPGPRLLAGRTVPVHLGDWRRGLVKGRATG